MTQRAHLRLVRPEDVERHREQLVVQRLERLPRPRRRRRYRLAALEVLVVVALWGVAAALLAGAL